MIGFVVLGIVFNVVSVYVVTEIAESKNRSALGWGLWALITGPLAVFQVYCIPPFEDRSTRV